MKYIHLIMFLLVAGCSSSPSPVLPPVKLTAVKNEFSVRKLWSRDIGEGASDNYLKLTPAISGEQMYTIDHKGTVTAFNTKTRVVIWEKELATKIGSPVTLHKDQLLIGTSDGSVFSLSKKSGKINWRSTISSEVLAAPQAAQGIVVVRCVNGQLYGLDLETGKQLWLIEQRTPSLTLRGTSEPVISGDLVLNTFDNGRLVAVNLQSGKIIWQSSIAVPKGRTDLERMIDADANPVVVDDIVYAVAFQGRLVAMQLGSGRIIWTRDLDSYVGMAVDPYKIYLADSQGIIWALDRATGATLWKQDALLRRSITKPQLHKQYIIVADFNGFLHWIRRDNGKIAARVRLDVSDYIDPDLDESEDLIFPKSGNILVSPVTKGNTLIAMDRYGHTEAFEVSYP